MLDHATGFHLFSKKPVRTPQMVVTNLLRRKFVRKTQQSIPSESMSFASKGSNDGPWLYVIFMSVIFEVEVHLAASSLLDQLVRNLTGKDTPQTGSRRTST